MEKDLLMVQKDKQGLNQQLTSPQKFLWPSQGEMFRYYLSMLLGPRVVDLSFIVIFYAKTSVRHALII